MNYCTLGSNSISAYPYFDVIINQDINTFRFINRKDKPMISNRKEAYSLLTDFLNIVQNNIKCVGDNNCNFSFSEKKIMRILQKKTLKIESQIQPLSFFETIKFTFSDIDYPSEIKSLMGTINHYAAIKIGIWSAGDALLVIADCLDVRSASRLLRTCKNMKRIYEPRFSKTFEGLKPYLQQQLECRRRREVAPVREYRFDAAAEERRQNRLACLH